MENEGTFRTRAELVSGFESSLRGGLEEYEQEGKTGEGWIKTQLIERGVKGDSENHDTVLNSLKSIEENAQIQVSELGEELFFSAKTSIGSQVYIDAEDPRFILLYSKTKSDEFKRLIERITSNVYFDHAWFPEGLLYGFKKLGKFRGYGGKFNNEYFLDTNADSPLENEENPLFQDLSFKSWGQTERLLTLIRGDQELSNYFALTNLRLRKEIAENSADFVIDDITYSGKVTSLGRSFIAHRRLMDEIKTQYKSAVVDVIEDRYGFRLEEGEIHGGVLTYTFPAPLDQMGYNIEEFISKLFSGRQPYMIWGISTKVANTMYRVNAVDLHIGQRLTFEVHANKLDLILTSGVCGNTVMRLWALLQQHLNSRVKLINEDAEYLFGESNA